MCRHSLLLLSIGMFLAATSGCQGEQGPAASSAELPPIPVSRPVERMVTNFEDFTGRTDAVQVVDLRARVTGYLDKMPFKEGSEIKEGDVLFEIDSRPYKAQLDQAQSQVVLNEASLKLARTTLDRDLAIASTVNGGVSQQQLDQDKAAVDEAVARLNASKASTKVYDLNLDFTKVKSPIDGMVSRYYLTRGNLVNQDQTLLTTVVSLDPMYAYFDMDEPSLIRIRRAIIDGRLDLPEDGAMRVLLGLPSEDSYTHEGTLNFLNNQINSGTASLSMRGVFANPKLSRGLPSLAASTIGLLSSHEQGTLLALPGLVNAKGTRLLSPGMFVRIRLPIGEAYKARLVIDRAIQSDQGLKYLYVIDKDDKVQYRRITTGALQADGLRVIGGVEADEWIVVGGLQQVRPKMQINPQKTDMPLITGRTTSSDDKVTR